MDTEKPEQTVLQKAQDEIMLLQDELGRLYSEPCVHATVIHAENKLDPSRFLRQDLVGVMTGDYEGHVGRVVGKVNSNGEVDIIFPDLTTKRYQVGTHGHPEVKLLNKNDGTNVVVLHEGENYEVFGIWGQKFHPGQPVKINLKTKQIVDPNGIQSIGEICTVKRNVDDFHTEVEVNGSCRLVFNSLKGIETNDRVQLDKRGTIILSKIGRIEEERYRLPEEINVTWDDIGGCEEAKAAMIDALELPFKHPEIYKYYNKKMPKGVLLYGGPGVGKTMLGKAAATSAAKTFGKASLASGFIYVKGPELLNKWLGNTEQNIRELFHRGRKHHEKHGYPAILFVDEAEAILPMRGSSRSSDAENTFVPMFLSEMDGLETSHVIVVLATNRPESLDPAAIRPGRVDRHIKVPRPNLTTSAEILKLHLRSVPLFETNIESISALIAAELFSNYWTIYKVFEQCDIGGQKNVAQHMFYLKDCVNGAMLAAIVEQATMTALKRDLLSKSKNRGVKTEDFRDALRKMYFGQLDQNHTFDLEDFCDTHKINRCKISLEKMGAV